MIVHTSYTASRERNVTLYTTAVKGSAEKVDGRAKGSAHGGQQAVWQRILVDGADVGSGRGVCGWGWVFYRAVLSWWSQFWGGGHNSVPVVNDTQDNYITLAVGITQAATDVQESQFKMILWLF